MLHLLASLALAEVPTAVPPAVPSQGPSSPIVTAGPGRPVIGIGAGVRGGTSSAGFVTSVRIRVTPWFVVDPMVYVLVDTTDTSTVSQSGADPATRTETEASATDTTGYGALALRFRVAEGRRASGWVLATGSLVSMDQQTTGPTAVGDAEAAENLERFQAISGTAGLGFGGELWLRPELTLSADAGFNLWSGAKTVREVDGSDVIATTNGFTLSPFAQLAIHLYL